MNQEKEVFRTEAIFKIPIRYINKMEKRPKELMKLKGNLMESVVERLGS